MGTTPEHIKRIMQINAHPKFHIEWVDRLDGLYHKIDGWIKRAGLEEDRHELEKIVAWMVPCLCADPKSREESCEKGLEHFQVEWKRILGELKSLYRDDPLHRFLGLQKDDLERKIETAVIQADYFASLRGQRRLILDQGLDILVWRMADLGKTAAEQEYAILELFKAFTFANFAKMPTPEAYKIIRRIRKEALSNPRTELDLDHASG